WRGRDSALFLMQRVQLVHLHDFGAGRLWGGRLAGFFGFDPVGDGLGIDPKQASDPAKAVLLQIETDRLLSQGGFVAFGRGVLAITASAISAAKALFAFVGGADFDLAMAAATARAEPIGCENGFHTKSIPTT